MAEPLVASGHSVAILAWDTPNNRTRIDFEAPSAEILWLPLGLSGLVERKKKKQLAKAWKPDIVYICGFGIRNGLTRFEFSRSTHVLAEHSELSSKIPRPMLSRRKEQFMEWFSVVATDGLLCASRYLENYFRKMVHRWRNGKVPLIYYPYAYNQSILSVSVAAVERIAKLKSEKKTLLYMGTLAKNYGVLDLLHAVKILNTKRSDFLLHIFGRGRHAQEAHALSVELGVTDHVVFDGYVPEEDLGAWFQSADLFLMPIFDTIQDKARCPSKVYMYLPFEKPILTCKIGDPYDLLGDDGFYFESGNPVDLARAMDEALSVKGFALKTVNPKDHDWGARTNQFLDFIEGAAWK